MSDRRVIELILEGQDRATPEISDVRGGVRSLGTDMDSLNQSAIRAAKGLALAFGAREVLGFIVNVNRETQTLKARLETVEGSAAGAEAVFRDIERLAASTPFQIDQLTDAYIRLGNQGLKPTRPQLLAFGEIAAAQSKGIVDLAEAVNDAAVGEFERLKEFGIKVRAEGSNLAVSFKGQTTRIKRDGQSLIDLLVEIGQTQFAGGMERQMNTIDGAISNLMDNTAGLARALGDGGLTLVVQSAVGQVRDLTGAILMNRDEIVHWTRVTVAFGAVLVDVVMWIPRVADNAFNSVAGIITLFWEGLLAGSEQLQRVLNIILDAVDAIPGVDMDFRFEIDPNSKNRILTTWGVLTDELKRDFLEGPVRETENLLAAVGNFDMILRGPRATGDDLGLPGLDGNDGLVGDTAARRARLARLATMQPDFRAAEYARPSFAQVAGADARALGIRRGLRRDAYDTMMSGGIVMGDVLPSMDLQRWQAEAEEAKAIARDLANQLHQDLGVGLVGTMETLGTAVVGGLGGFDDALMAISGSVAQTLGEMMINAGTTIVLTSEGFARMRDSLFALMPGGGIAAGLALIAAGAAMKAATSSFLSNPTGGGGRVGSFGVGSSAGLSQFNQFREPGGRVQIVLQGGDIINMADPRQRASFRNAIAEITGSREIEFVRG